MVDTKVTGRELDALVAERVMGWPVVTQPHNPEGNDEWYASLSFPCLIFHTEGGYYLQRDYLPKVCDWRPSLEIATAMEVEDRIAALGMQKPYIQALGLIVAKAATEAGEIVGYWHFTHATAEQRCRAALVAIDSENQAGRGMSDGK